MRSTTKGVAGAHFALRTVRPKLGFFLGGAPVDAAKLLIGQAKVDSITATMLIDVLEHTWASVADQFDGHPAKIYGPITIANYLVTLAETGERDTLILERSALSRVQALLQPAKK
jgi:hypothetical protein